MTVELLHSICIFLSAEVTIKANNLNSEAISMAEKTLGKQNLAML